VVAFLGVARKSAAFAALRAAAALASAVAQSHLKALLETAAPGAEDRKEAAAPDTAAVAAAATATAAVGGGAAAIAAAAAGATAPPLRPRIGASAAASASPGMAAIAAAARTAASAVKMRARMRKARPAFKWREVPVPGLEGRRQRQLAEEWLDFLPGNIIPAGLLKALQARACAGRPLWLRLACAELGEATFRGSVEPEQLRMRIDGLSDNPEDVVRRKLQRMESR
jgi:hypothetical protein